MDKDNLVMLNLDLEIPNLWENKLVQNFPNTNFIIKSANSHGQNQVSGLLRIEKGNIRNIKKFISKNCNNVDFNVFHKDTNLCHYRNYDVIIPKILKNSKVILNWPVKFLEKNKRIKLISRYEEIDNIIEPIENSNINITKFSKVKINFDINDTLTFKQKKILEPSLKYGYYEFPKRINLNNLSQKIGISPSTLCVHLQKIESKILNSNYRDLFFNIL